MQYADEIVDVIQFPDSVVDLHEVLRNRVCLLRHGMRCHDSIKAADNAMNAFSELSGAIFSCGIGARDKAIKNYVSARAALAAAPDHIGGVTEMVAPDKPQHAALAPQPWGGPEGE